MRLLKDRSTRSVSVNDTSDCILDQLKSVKKSAYKDRGDRMTVINTGYNHSMYKKSSTVSCKGWAQPTIT